MVIALSLLFVLALTASAWANPACAVCTVAVGASLEIARQLGVDDSVVGVWAGAMLAIIGFWTIRWFEKKGWNFKGRDWTLIIVSVAMIGFMYISEIKYTPQVIGIFYLDPFLFSTVLGALVMVWSSDFYQWMKARNGGHAHFPFEKVAVPVVALLLVSAYFYYYPLTRKAADLGADLYTFWKKRLDYRGCFFNSMEQKLDHSCRYNLWSHGKRILFLSETGKYLHHSLFRYQLNGR